MDTNRIFVTTTHFVPFSFFQFLLISHKKTLSKNQLLLKVPYFYVLTPEFVAKVVWFCPLFGFWFFLLSFHPAQTPFRGFCLCSPSASAYRNTALSSSSGLCRLDFPFYFVYDVFSEVTGGYMPLNYSDNPQLLRIQCVVHQVLQTFRLIFIAHHLCASLIS